jgi:hypothetical protein
VTPATGTIKLPAGTSIPLTLMSSIKSKSTKPGDSVRAVVAFPVTAGAQLAIPAGTYAQGTVIRVNAKPLAPRQPTVSIHFTHLIFVNGYSVPLNGENTQSFLLRDSGATSTVDVAELVPLRLPGMRFAMGEGQQQQPPTLPQLGPSPGELVGISVGVTAAVLIASLLYVHHRANSYDFVVFDVGWQFQMVLDSPVDLDAAQVAAAAAIPAAN